VRIHRCVIRW